GRRGPVVQGPRRGWHGHHAARRPVLGRLLRQPHGSLRRAVDGELLVAAARREVTTIPIVDLVRAVELDGPGPSSSSRLHPGLQGDGAASGAEGPTRTRVRSRRLAIVPPSPSAG